MGKANDIVIRHENPSDYKAVEAIALGAFAPDTRVAELVRKLRSSPSLIPELNLVAEASGVVAGHIMFSRAELDSGCEVPLLSPLGVRPSFQRRNVGSRLVTHALHHLKSSDFPFVILEGVPGYYPRFGFVLASTLGIEPPYPVPEAAWQAYPLPAYQPYFKGKIKYPEPFDFLYNEEQKP